MKLNFKLVMALLMLMAVVSCSNDALVTTSDKAESNDSRTVATDWETWTDYVVGQVVKYDGKVYSCRQSHTSQPDWTPNIVPALWSFVSDTGDQDELKLIDRWSAEDTYPASEVVYFEESYFKSRSAHAAQPLYKPTAVPALWEAVPAPANAVTLDQFDIAQPNRIDGNTIYYEGQGGSSASKSTVTLVRTETDKTIQRGQDFTLQFDIKRIGDDEVNSFYGDNTPLRATVSVDGKWYSGAYVNYTLSKDQVVTVTLTVDNVGISGDLDWFGFMSYQRIETDVVVENISYTITGSQDSKIRRNQYPNRQLSAYFLANPIYAISDTISQKDMEDEIQREFVQWREKYLRDASQWGATGKYIQYGGGVEKMPGDMVPMTTSESHGYGMLILALMENELNDTQDDFNAMVDYYLHFQCLDDAQKPLMAWQQSISQSGEVEFTTIVWSDDAGASVEGPAVKPAKHDLIITPTQYVGKIVDGKEVLDSKKAIWGGDGGAPDGDMDIAYALLLAHNMWGSTPEYNYLELATDLVSKIEELYIAKYDNSAHILTQSGMNVWMTDALMDGYDDYKVTRASDAMFINYIAFMNLGESHRKAWSEVYNSMKRMVNEVTSDLGLSPDFAVYDPATDTYNLPEGQVLETEEDKAYYWNACRVPMRLAMHHYDRTTPWGNFFTSGHLTNFNDFFQSKTNGDITLYENGYWIDSGEAIPEHASAGVNLSFTAPALAGSIAVYPQDRSARAAELEALYNHVTDDQYINSWTKGVPDETKDYVGYYDETLRIMSLLTATGNFIKVNYIEQ